MSEFVQTSYSYLQTVSKPDEILKHQLNKSPTKQQYSFRKSERFRESDSRLNCKTDFYTINEKLFRDQRACSMVFGNRFNHLNKHNPSPPPNKYYPKNNTIESMSKKGFTFGVAREKCPQLGILPMMSLSKLRPGPGTYNPESIKNKKNISFHIRHKELNRDYLNTGPGKYDIKSSFEPVNLIHNSKYRSVVTVKFCPLRSQANDVKLEKAKNKENEVAPVYDKTYQMNTTGVFFNSKYKNSRCRYFSKQKRNILQSINSNPGPGSYGFVSEFGIYESSNAHSSRMKSSTD